MEHVPAAEAEHKASSSEVEPAASLEVNSARLKRRGNGARPHPPSKAEHASGYVGGTGPGRCCTKQFTAMGNAQKEVDEIAKWLKRVEKKKCEQHRDKEEKT
jgi:hypothetical protein